MSDFIVQFGDGDDARRLERSLRDRPGVGDRAVTVHRFDWGVAVVQAPASAGFAPIEKDGALYCCAGRPTFLDEPAVCEGHAWFTRELARRCRSQNLADVANGLSGMYVVARCDKDGVTVMTDPMGVFPAYIARRGDGRIAAQGTLIELVAHVAGRTNDFDEVSLSELLAFGQITLPYTSRRGIEELRPGSLYRLRAEGQAVSIQHETIWQPLEPTTFASLRELDEQLEHAIRSAARKITQGASRVATTISGGKDSRVLPNVLPKEKLAAAITYITRENRETRVAQRVAEAAGLPHRFAHRGPEFYAQLMARGVDLMGSELRSNQAGFCVVDEGLNAEYDLIVYGYQSDSNLKDHGMPAEVKQRMQLLAPVSRAKHMLRRCLGMTAPAQGTKFAEDSPLLAHLQGDLRESVAARRSARLAELAQIRPQTAVEWSQIYPVSRMPAASQIIGNCRLFSSDSVFTHREVVDVGARIPQQLRYQGRLAQRVFNRLYGSLGDIECANTGVPANAGWRAEHRAWKQRSNDAKRLKAFKRLSPSDTPWNDVQSSWIDLKALQKHSAVWAQYRRELQTSPMLELLEPLVDFDVRQALGQFQDHLAVATNYMIVQLSYLMAHKASGADRREVAGVQVAM